MSQSSGNGTCCFGGDSKITAAVLGSFALGVVVGAAILGGYKKKMSEQPMVNLTIDKSNPKVVHTCQIADVEEAGKKVMCRCWKSEKFPYCDGAHVKHNKETGDNVGPLIVTK
mmetsp:Transcript_22504/g.39886  ORF Transcript_22504/g.39886 Transcript_22504/m.39886 type:complete len:113 (-) Transcript_22504:1088-1426(-)|eukprot:CAMPEP_0184553170 /NCGR_PEP_ID=MMETSP0199_2-20130426/31154_1 /TAXON_ID=1112570 /ORGANISM="Thraustochytrium sp., Strain LLF1b" /LENGTH=112 /DNA_ID=CAMNT_0026948853 /DNA_START=138 /DNA_END=476 /DNA_ORIENTATION=-